MHADDKLIDPFTLKQYRESKTTIRTKSVLKKKFFKHIRHFVDEDFRVFLIHLLDETPNYKVAYPKFSVERP